MALYRLISWLALPILALRALWAARDPAARAIWAERFGLGAPVPEGGGRVIWLHGASNGELTSARPLILALLEAQPAVRLVVTANSASGRAMAAGWGLPRVAVRAAPLDLGPALGRFFDRWRPVALITLESEIWPLRFAMARQRGVPVLMVGARLSERALVRWRKMPRLWQAVSGAITWLSAQDDGSRERFVALGLGPGVAGPVVNLKPLAAGRAVEAPEAGPDRARTLLAASTHEGEEEAVLDALAPLIAEGRLRLILAPRHPARGDEVAAALARRGLPVARRSLGAAFTGQPVYLADTLGEMPIWYRAAGLSFVGGSLANRGGHTPFEPAAHGSAILHGPHVANFRDAYGALAAAGGALPVADGTALLAAVAALLADPSAQGRMAQAAEAALFGQSDPDALAPILAAIAREAHL